MLIQYKDIDAHLVYCGKTRTFYGEIPAIDDGLVFQASNRQHAIKIMHWIVDAYLQQDELQL